MGVWKKQKAVGKDKRPLLTSGEWVDIQAEMRLGRNEWQEMDRTQNLQRFEDLWFPRRRPARKSTEDLDGNQEKAKPMDVSPGCQEDGEERNPHNLNRGKRPKSTTSERSCRTAIDH